MTKHENLDRGTEAIFAERDRARELARERLLAEADAAFRERRRAEEERRNRQERALHRVCVRLADALCGALALLTLSAAAGGAAWQALSFALSAVLCFTCTADRH